MNPGMSPQAWRKFHILALKISRKAHAAKLSKTA
jgi:hypothetical protein